ncbi:MAG: hypothetical protein C4523_09790 [Myxococcales bacterium]|nr:MAG: hypothetical protein C4523_09790 [Myxococcales bacterium]
MEYREAVDHCADCGRRLVDGPMPPDEEDFVELYACATRLDAERLKAMLTVEKLVCNLREMGSTSFPTGGGVYGEVRLVVRRREAEQAAELIRQAMQDGEISPEAGEFVEEE